MYAQRARGRGFSVSPDAFSSLDSAVLSEMLLSPSSCRIKDQWSHCRGAHEALNGALMCDLEQSPYGTNPCGGQDWPPQMTHGTVVSLERDRSFRIAVGLEHLSCMGLHIWTDTTRTHAQTKLLPFLRRCSENNLKTFGGNGMHLASPSSFMLYVLSNCRRIQK